MVNHKKQNEIWKISLKYFDNPRLNKSKILHFAVHIHKDVLMFGKNQNGLLSKFFNNKALWQVK